MKRTLKTISVTLVASICCTGALSANANAAVPSQPDVASTNSAPCSVSALQVTHSKLITSDGTHREAEFITPEARANLDTIFKASGMPNLPQTAQWLSLDPHGKIFIFDAHGNDLNFVNAEGNRFGFDDILNAARWVMEKFAKFVVGCAGGALGFDQLLKMLETRAITMWGLTSLIAKRVGPIAAAACVAGGIAKAFE